MSLATAPTGVSRPRLRFELNGEAVEVEVEVREMLLDVLRGPLGLRGAKRSCDLQVCGACTVLVDGLVVSACTYLAYEVDGRTVTTIEGLASGEALHPLQREFVRRGGLQCGFCTSGMILTLKAFLEEHPGPTEQEIREALAGNLCRCTGYVKVVDAALAAVGADVP